MGTRYPRSSVILYPDINEPIERLMAQHNTRQSVILHQALRKGLRLMEQEQQMLEQMRAEDSRDSVEI